MSAADDEFIELECDYFTVDSGAYICVVEDVELRDRNIHVNFTGQHLEGKAEEDVIAFVVLFSDVRFIAPEIFTTFPNLIELDFFYAGLQEIDALPEIPNLIAFVAFGNDIRAIYNNTFSNVGSTLMLLDIGDNNIEEIEPDAFVGLSELLLFGMMFNPIVDLPQRVFWPMTSVTIMDLEDTQLQVINEELFEMNRNLVALGIDYNGIDRIAPTFFAPLRQSLIILFAYRNPCNNRNFEIVDEVVEAFMHTSLRNCYNNFMNITANDTHSVVFEYTGSLRLFDDFGNLILAAN